MKTELIEGSETSVVRTQTLGNYPKENILHIEHGESLKPRIQQKFFLIIFYCLGQHVSILIDSSSGPSKNTDPY